MQHWSSQKEETVREEDVEAAADEPLLGRAPEHPRSILNLPMLAPNSLFAEAGTVVTLLTGATCIYEGLLDA